MPQNTYLGTNLPEKIFAINYNKYNYTGSQSPSTGLFPTNEECFSLWKKYEMPQHIQEHSTSVAKVADTIATIIKEQNIKINLDEIHAAALLHDLAKHYCIQFGGSHAQLGASWVIKETRNHRIGQAVLHHVYWPFTPNIFEDAWLMPLIIVYADKRVKHHQIVSLEERYDDLINRYGKTKEIIERIKLSQKQGTDLEKALSERFGVNLNEYSFNSGRLV
ncbi:HD domain-containing protein [Desulfovibrio litoralis]|uniref:HD domain-containing protein n=1 Tax=Desulfovibrio litoralis DSM 11393 TaxID=1121455 RepID=A0A1M7T5J6_9BACT|nr:HD domain-containing protein [Desulfovibrio litoralis]SHN65999.1 HD domain-containing protein [Desulfovibrio litoralis DSM 11393]